MANSRFEYVKKFELDDQILPGCWIVIRLDGKGFTKFTKQHGFEKPNDVRGLELMNKCALEVLKTFGEVRLAFGQSDEYSFVIHKNSDLYVFFWKDCFPQMDLVCTPCFDGRAVAYPSDQILLDYLSWRQSDTHINNQYNTCFWSLVKDGVTPEAAQAMLKGTLTDFKNELMHSRFGINYNALPAQFRKGSVVFKRMEKVAAKQSADGSTVFRERMVPIVVHQDIIGKKFWQEHPELLS